MTRILHWLRNIHAILWLAWHWKDLRQETRDGIFQDMLRIRGYKRKVQNRSGVKVRDDVDSEDYGEAASFVEERGDID